MSKWVFRLTGLLVVVLVALLFLDNWLHPNVPNVIEQGVDVHTQGNHPNEITNATQDEQAPPLSLTSLENQGIDAVNEQAPVKMPATPEAPALSLTALDDETPPLVLSNPDAKATKAWLQAGSFGERANADKRAAVLKAQSWPVEIEQATVKGKSYYRVFIGPLTNDQASAYLKKLDAMDISAREVNR